VEEEFDGAPSTPPRLPQMARGLQGSEVPVAMERSAPGKKAAVVVEPIPSGASLGMEPQPLISTSEQVAIPEASSTSNLSTYQSVVAAQVDNISSNDLQQIRGIGRSHAAVREVVETSVMILGYPDATWMAAQAYFERADAFLDKMRNFDASRCVSRLQFQKLCRGLTSPQHSFAEGTLEPICPAALGLARWCRAVAELVAARYGESIEQHRVGPSGVRRKSFGRQGDGPAGLASSPRRERERETRIDEDGGVDAQLSPPSRPDLGDIEVSPDVYSMSSADLRRVRDFTIRKAGIGEVSFPGELDLVSHRKVLEDLPTIVRLEMGEVVVYPDSGSKPPEGVGLNRAALITLFQCKPPSGSLSDAESKARYRERIARMTEAKGAAFVDYDCDRGIWRFRVEHF